MTERMDRLFARAEAVLDRRANGHGDPILRHLALRRYGPAMLSLACRGTNEGLAGELGRLGDALSPGGLMYRAFRQGVEHAAQNMALSYFYVGDLAGYRRWLHRAAQTGDRESARELKRFEIRQPYPLAKRLRRLRPLRRDEA